MEMTRHNDKRHKAYFAFGGTCITGGTWNKTKMQVKGICCSTSAYEIRNLNQHLTSNISNVLTDKGEFYTSLNRLEPDSIRKATNKEIEEYTKGLAALNLHIAEAVETFKYLTGMVDYNQINSLQFIDPSAVCFSYDGKEMTRSEFEEMEIPKDKALLYYFDNGFSYMGAEPTTKESFLKSVDSLLTQPHFSNERQGVWLTRKSNTDPYMVKVYIGENKQWSETSNS